MRDSNKLGTMQKNENRKKCEKTIVMHLHSWKLKDIVTQHEQSLCHLIPGYLWNRKVKKKYSKTLFTDISNTVDMSKKKSLNNLFLKVFLSFISQKHGYLDVFISG